MKIEKKIRKQCLNIISHFCSADFQIKERLSPCFIKYREGKDLIIFPRRYLALSPDLVLKILFHEIIHAEEYLIGKPILSETRITEMAKERVDYFRNHKKEFKTLYTKSGRFKESLFKRAKNFILKRK